jgi:hypothetical protein
VKSLLRDLVSAAVRLAIARHGLMQDEYDLGDDDAKAIAADTWDALNGIDTCAGKMAPELAAVLLRMPADGR